METLRKHQQEWGLGAFDPQFVFGRIYLFEGQFGQISFVQFDFGHERGRQVFI